MKKADLIVPFEITDEVGNFLEDYDLWDEVEVTGDVSQYTKQVGKEKGKGKGKGLKLVKSDIDLDEPYAQIKPDIAGELEKTYEIFTEGENEVYDSLNEIKDKLQADVDQMIKELSKKADKSADFVDAEATYKTHGDSISFSVSFDTDDDEEEFYPSSLTWDTSDDSTSSSAHSFNWLAWFGVWNSPFQDDFFEEGYKLHDAANALGELWSTSYSGEEGGNYDRDNLQDLIWKMLDQEGAAPETIKPKFKDPGKNEIEKRQRDKKHLKLVKSTLLAALRKLA
jgi:hypothetical protein